MIGRYRPGEERWLPTLICDRAPTASEARKAVSDYVAEIARISKAAV
jgi:hypothetical protein